MVFAYYRFRLWYKIDRSCGIRQSKKYFIICDHHRPGEFLPDAVAILTQNETIVLIHDELCGCGIGFKIDSSIVQPKPNHRRFDSVFRFSVGCPLISFP
jgi:hypothetical protein